MKCFIFTALFIIICYMSETVQSHDFHVPIPCSNDDDCKRLLTHSNTLCNRGICVCNDGGVIQNCKASSTILSSTKATVPIGRECKHPVDCKLENSFCNTTISQCLCKREFISNIHGNKCLPVVKMIGGKCEDNKQCLVYLSNTTCSMNQCVCIDGFHYADKSCYENKEIGDSCKNTNECSHIAHAECNQQNICVCSSDSVLNSDRKRCLPLARELSTQCDESAQCIATLGDNTECSNNVCQCLSFTHFVPEIHRCVANKHVDENCENDYDCYQNEYSDLSTIMKCVNKICTCADNYIKLENKCVTSAASAIIFKMSGLLIFFTLIFRL